MSGLLASRAARAPLAASRGSAVPRAAERRGRRAVRRAVPKGEGFEEPRLDKGFLDKEAVQNYLDELLPGHQPGEFPETGAHPTGWTELSTEEEEVFDPLRDGPLRYLGYANELGEAFGAWLPAGGVPLSYAVAIAYVLVDTLDKGVTARKESVEQLQKKSALIPPTLNKMRLANVLAGERALDTIVWQLLASVAIPGFTIHQVVALTSALLHPHLMHLSPGEMHEMEEAASALHIAVSFLVATIDKMVPTVMGLVAIPFIVHPIDEGVHGLLDRTLRPTMKSVICDNMEGKEAGLDICAFNPPKQLQDEEHK